MAKGRQCTICMDLINPQERRSIIAIKSFKFYKDYVVDISRPTQRKAHVWCPNCTSWFISVLNQRLADVADLRVANEERHRGLVRTERWGSNAAKAEHDPVSETEQGPRGGGVEVQEHRDGIAREPDFGDQVEGHDPLHSSEGE